jgi:hypothetical protein
MTMLFSLNIALQWLIDYHENVEEQLKGSRESLRLKLQKLSRAEKQSVYENHHFSVAQMGYFLHTEVDSKKYSDLSSALNQCISLPSDSCAGVTGIQEGKSNWTWSLRKGTTLML